jgi:hypothetical protein
MRPEDRWIWGAGRVWKDYSQTLTLRTRQP